MTVNRALIYVEGPSDQLSMRTLFGPLISQAEQKGVKISFHVFSKGGERTGGKHALINKGVAKAANALVNDPGLCVVIMPDLYPKDQGGPHKTPEELSELLLKKFQQRLARERLTAPSEKVSSRFRAFCFKHDLEALLLAAHEQMASHLGLDQLERTWTEPVEDQDHDTPPKRVVEEIFKRHRKKYVETDDAPAILEHARLDQLADRCPQCFQPFVEFIRALAN